MNPESETPSSENSDVPAQNVRTLEGDIIDFTSTLPFWEQYLSEKILAGSEITDEDYEKALQYFFEDAGLLESTGERSEINIICKDHTGTYKTDLKLTKISGVEGINALVPGQVLEFGKNLTIIYGSNGSGKSGYIRLLNNVFITKGEKTILPNIHDTTPLTKKAEFEFNAANSNYALNFPMDCAKPEFKQFSVFDEKAVHAHLNNKNQFEFRPSGLSYFAAITESCKKMDEFVQQQIDQHVPTSNLVALFDGESAIKTLIASLSDKTKLEYFKEYKEFNDNDREERRKLEESKAALMALKKDKEISDLNQIKTQLNAFKTNLINVNRYFNTDQLSKAAEKIKSCVDREKLAATNNIDQFKNIYVTGVGDTAWREFIVAADAFAKLQGNPPGDYPGKNDICMLCHQPLSDEAAKLVSSYWTFIKSKAEQDAKDAQTALINARAAFEKLDLNLLPDNTTLYKWFSENKNEELKQVNKKLTELAELKGEIIKNIDARSDEQLAENQADLLLVDNIVADIDQKIESLQASDVSKEIAELDQKIIFLNHKEKLKTHYATVEKAVADYQWVAKAQKAKGKINKRDITNKEKELSNQYFNQAYIDKFNDECLVLNGNFGITINHTGSAGTSYRQLNLKGKQPTDILSEGEQKVISLADFFSETTLSGINRGIIFDDPVTSLDEERKSQIAERLTKESLIRQVVVFTHDLVFVSQLIGCIQDIGSDHLCHWIEQRNGKPGYVSLKNAPSYEKEYKNADKPRNLYHQANKTDCPAATRELLIQQSFTSLRTCYETLVVFGMFNGVVQRFVERISIDSLEKVTIDPLIKAELMESFGLCCRYMEGHSHSDRYAYRKPKLEDLDTEIKRYDDLRIKIKKAQK
ncbi:AAA family ATPase [Mucilaginibacter sp.]|uniref:AAA family ATPase n=1 Tax=Mucilaginibacter sp. TaxID=1882438 RepID=UPI002ED417CC